MKKLMITGGLIGFAIGIAFGISERSNGAAVLWRACVAAAVSGLLFRWWGKLWINSLQQAHHERLAAAAQAEASAPAKS
jgi:phosphotransferase system  glucose/maltose/N-acetylglucosamine-specific IIC component